MERQRSSVQAWESVHRTTISRPLYKLVNWMIFIKACLCATVAIQLKFLDVQSWESYIPKGGQECTVSSTVCLIKDISQKSTFIPLNVHVYFFIYFCCWALLNACCSIKSSPIPSAGAVKLWISHAVTVPAALTVWPIISTHQCCQLVFIFLLPEAVALLIPSRLVMCYWLSLPGWPSEHLLLPIVVYQKRSTSRNANLNRKKIF